ncbi:hypothetical protein Tco_0857274 [Tanacetum coccineum]|uniref:Uncharacterized protein n=1 Tax=Tanacetum coccineum TaxID=301880 RepID=A0ABQ5B7W5_9ASTR
MEEDDEEQLPRENMVGSYYEEQLRREEQEKVSERKRFSEEAIKLCQMSSLGKIIVHPCVKAFSHVNLDETSFAYSTGGSPN